MVNVACVLAEGFEESEAILVVDILRRAQFHVDLVSLDDVLVRSARGVQILADKRFEAMDDYDMIFLPGGSEGAKRLAADERVMNLLQSYTAHGKQISAVCAAPAVLAKAGVLKNQTFTAHPSVLKDPHFEGAQLSLASVVHSGNLITSRGLGTTLDFALALVETLGGDAAAIAEAIVYTKDL